MKLLPSTTLALIGICCLFPATTRADGSTSEQDKSAANADASSRHAAEQISFELWIVSLGKSEKDADDDELDQLLARAGGLPTVVGSSDDARALIHRLSERKAVRAIQEYRLTTLDGCKATVLFSQRVPQIIRVTLNDRGQTNNITFQEVGTNLELIPSLRVDRAIQVDISVETSGLEESHDAAIAIPSQGKAIYASIAVARRITTSVSIESGAAVLVGQLTDKMGRKAELVILSATIVGPKPGVNDGQSLAPDS